MKTRGPKVVHTEAVDAKGEEDGSENSCVPAAADVRRRTVDDVLAAVGAPENDAASGHQPFKFGRLTFAPPKRRNTAPAPTPQTQRALVPAPPPAKQLHSQQKKQHRQGFICAENRLPILLPVEVLETYVIPWFDYRTVCSAERVCKTWRQEIRKTTVKARTLALLIGGVKSLDGVLRDAVDELKESLATLDPNRLPEQIDMWRLSLNNLQWHYATVTKPETRLDIKTYLHFNSDFDFRSAVDEFRIYHVLAKYMYSQLQPLICHLDTLAGIDQTWPQTTLEAQHASPQGTILGDQPQFVIRNVFPVVKGTLEQLLAAIDSTRPILLDSVRPFVRKEQSSEWITKFAADHLLFFVTSITHSVLKLVQRGFVPLRHLFEVSASETAAALEETVQQLTGWREDIVKPVMEMCSAMRNREMRNTLHAYEKKVVHMVGVMLEVKELALLLEAVVELDPCPAAGKGGGAIVADTILAPLVSLEAELGHPNTFLPSFRHAFDQLSNRLRTQLRSARPLLLQKKALSSLDEAWEQRIHRSRHSCLI